MDNQKQNLRKLFIPGAEIGGMKIIEQISNKTRYKVQCLTCGKVCDIHETTLRRRLEHPDDVGCPTCARSRCYKKLIIHNAGEVIGDYKLIEPYNGSRKNGMWKVQCLKCNNTLVISLNNAKKRKREGCFYCNPGKGQRIPATYNEPLQVIKSTMYTRDERYYKAYKNKIEAMNKRSNQGTGRKLKEWELSLEDFSTLVHQKCHYCGADPAYKPEFTPKSDPDNKLYANGIDRIDSDKGYTKENCVPCCSTCNRMKLDLSVSDFYTHIKQILNYSQKCSTTIENTDNSGSE